MDKLNTTDAPTDTKRKTSPAAAQLRILGEQARTSSEPGRVLDLVCALLAVTIEHLEQAQDAQALEIADLQAKAELLRSEVARLTFENTGSPVPPVQQPVTAPV